VLYSGAVLPFRVGVFTNGDGLTSTGGGTDGARGFSIRYVQNPCVPENF